MPHRWAGQSWLEPPVKEICCLFSSCCERQLSRVLKAIAGIPTALKDKHSRLHGTSPIDVSDVLQAIHGGSDQLLQHFVHGTHPHRPVHVVALPLQDPHLEQVLVVGIGQRAHRHLAGCGCAALYVDVYGYQALQSQTIALKNYLTHTAGMQRFLRSVQCVCRDALERPGRRTLGSGLGVCGWLVRAWLPKVAFRNLMMRSAAAPYLGSPVSLLRWMNSICGQPPHMSSVLRLPSTSCTSLQAGPFRRGSWQGVRAGGWQQISAPLPYPRLLCHNGPCNPGSREEHHL